MLGQAHTPRRRSFPVAAIAVAVLAVPAVGSADPSHGTASLQAQNAALAAKKRSVVLSLYSLDQQLAAAQARLGTLRREAAALRAERASLAHQVAVARRGTKIGEAQLAQRLRALYEQGNVAPLDIVLGAKSLDAAVSGIDSLTRVSGQAEDVLAQLKEARARLGTAAARLTTRESRLAAATRETTATATALQQKRAERNAYIASLAARQRLNAVQIARIVTQARAAEARSAKLARSTAAESVTTVAAPTVAVAAAPAAPAPVASNGRTITVSATGYALGGRTATGLPVGWGVVAVDPSVIPLGTHMTIPGYGEAVAADTGGAVVGAAIDVWFPSVAQANAWGRRTVTITLH